MEVDSEDGNDVPHLLPQGRPNFLPQNRSNTCALQAPAHGEKRSPLRKTMGAMVGRLFGAGKQASKGNDDGKGPQHQGASTNDGHQGGVSAAGDHGGDQPASSSAANPFVPLGSGAEKRKRASGRKLFVVIENLTNLEAGRAQLIFDSEDSSEYTELISTIPKSPKKSSSHSPVLLAATAVPGGGRFPPSPPASPTNGVAKKRKVDTSSGTNGAGTTLSGSFGQNIAKTTSGASSSTASKGFPEPRVEHHSPSRNAYCSNWADAARGI